MSLLPSSPDLSPESEPRVVGLDTEEADALMAALSSETARRLLSALHEDPAPPGRLAERVGTSLQNAQYHLEKLEAAGAVEVVGTAYSEKGREMQVYGPADSPLVIFAGEEERASGLRAAVARLFGGFAALAAGALVVQELFGRSLFRRTAEDGAPTGGGDGAGGGGATTTPTERSDDGPSTAGADEGDGSAEPTATVESDEGETPAETAQPEATYTESGADSTDGAGAAGGPDTATPSPTDVEPTAVPDGGWELDPLAAFDGLVAGGIPPGLAFFLGGATVLTFLVAMTYVRAHPRL